MEKDAEQKQPQNNHRVVSPNDYSNSNNQQKATTDSFNKTQISPTKININQVLIDFRSTINAIGASEDIEKEVITYLGLVETQSQKPTPNKKMIVSNLKIAADVLDGYISETLNKPSKVVKDWIEALLLQNIDFKADANVTKGAFESITGEAPKTEKLAERKLAEKNHTNKALEITSENVISENAPPIEIVNSTEIQPQVSSEITSLINDAQNYISIAPQKALDRLSKAFSIAQNNSDKASMSEIYSKIALVHNNINNLEQALDCYNASTVIAYQLGNDNLKTQNHKQMGKIYNDAGYVETAISHYYASLGLDGKLEDINNQADTLNIIGQMYTDRFVEDEAISYYKDALELAKVTKNLDLMSTSFKNTAITFSNAGEQEKALANYKQAAILSQKSGNENNLAEIYEKAADLMNDMNHKKRAADLYKKSYRIAQKTNDNDCLTRIREKLLSIA